MKDTERKKISKFLNENFNSDFPQAGIIRNIFDILGQKEVVSLDELQKFSLSEEATRSFSKNIISFLRDNRLSENVGDDFLMLIFALALFPRHQELEVSFGPNNKPDNFFHVPMGEKSCHRIASALLFLIKNIPNYLELIKGETPASGYLKDLFISLIILLKKSDFFKNSITNTQNTKGGPENIFSTLSNILFKEEPENHVDLIRGLLPVCERALEKTRNLDKNKINLSYYYMLAVSGMLHSAIFQYPLRANSGGPIFPKDSNRELIERYLGFEEKITKDDDNLFSQIMFLTLKLSPLERIGKIAMRNASDEIFMDRCFELAKSGEEKLLFDPNFSLVYLDSLNIIDYSGNSPKTTFQEALKKYMMGNTKGASSKFLQVWQKKDNYIQGFIDVLKKHREYFVKTGNATKLVDYALNFSFEKGWLCDEDVPVEEAKRAELAIAQDGYELARYCSEVIFSGIEAGRETKSKERKKAIREVSQVADRRAYENQEQLTGYSRANSLMVYASFISKKPWKANNNLTAEEREKAEKEILEGTKYGKSCITTLLEYTQLFPKKDFASYYGPEIGKDIVSNMMEEIVDRLQGNNANETDLDEPVKETAEQFIGYIAYANPVEALLSSKLKGQGDSLFNNICCVFGKKIYKELSSGKVSEKTKKFIDNICFSYIGQTTQLRKDFGAYNFFVLVIEYYLLHFNLEFFNLFYMDPFFWEPNGFDGEYFSDAIRGRFLSNISQFSCGDSEIEQHAKELIITNNDLFFLELRKQNKFLTYIETAMQGRSMVDLYKLGLIGGHSMESGESYIVKNANVNFLLAYQKNNLKKTYAEMLSDPLVRENGELKNIFIVGMKKIGAGGGAAGVGGTRGARKKSKIPTPVPTGGGEGDMIQERGVEGGRITEQDRRDVLAFLKRKILELKS